MKVKVLDQDVVWRDLDGEVVMLNLATGIYFGLDGTGNEMWRQLIEHGSTEKVVDILSAEYDVEPAQLERDLDALVRSLAEKHIVQLE